MLVARKTLSIGQFTLYPGELLTKEMEEILPPGRTMQLQNQGYLEDKVEVEFLDLLRMVQALEARVARLEAPSELEPTRRGRQPKSEDIDNGTRVLS